MATRQKSTALYPHPFSKAYWRDAAAELKDIKMLNAKCKIAVSLRDDSNFTRLMPGKPTKGGARKNIENGDLLFGKNRV